MGMTLTINCDHCTGDITTTGNSVDYRLALRTEAIPSGGGAVTDMMIYPPLNRDHFFCGRGCLLAWAAAQLAADQARHASAIACDEWRP